MFKENIGKSGKMIRFGIGALLALGAVFYSSWILLLLALFCFFQAAMGWCLVCEMTGKNCCTKEDACCQIKPEKNKNNNNDKDIDLKDNRPL